MRAANATQREKPKDGHMSLIPRADQDGDKLSISRTPLDRSKMYTRNRDGSVRGEDDNLLRIDWGSEIRFTCWIPFRTRASFSGRGPVCKCRTAEVLAVTGASSGFA